MMLGPVQSEDGTSAIDFTSQYPSGEPISPYRDPCRLAYDTVGLKLQHQMTVTSDFWGYRKVSI
jgi:hypothetical protein